MYPFHWPRKHVAVDLVHLCRSCSIFVILTEISQCGLHVAETCCNRNRRITTDWTLPMSSRDILKYRIFSHFWEKGYFLTGGGKFGGDFLIYPGMSMFCCCWLFVHLPAYC